MPDSQIGIILGLCTAFLWAMSPLFWASAGRRIGSVQVNVIRIALAAVALALLTLGYAIMRHEPLPLPSARQIMWLILSSMAGLFVGDAIGFESMVRIGARRFVQLMALSPVAAALAGWLLLDEIPGLPAFVGIAIVLGSICYIAYAEGKASNQQSSEPGRLSAVGLAMGVISALAIGLGAALMRVAQREPHPLDPMLAATIRVSAACPFLWALPLLRGQPLRGILAHMRHGDIARRILAGTILGPVLGMITYVAAFRHLQAATASTLVAMSPLFILPVVAVRYRARISPLVYLATITALAGVALIAYGRP